MSAPPATIFNVLRSTREDSPTFYCGKYKGKTFISILYYDIHYCDWVLELVGAKGDLLKFKQWLEDRYESARKHEKPSH